MIQIRNSVFETNSSSMHSLAIRGKEAFFPDEEQYFAKEDVWEDISWYKDNDKSLNENIVINFNKYEDENWYFGRAPFKILDSFFDKFKYAFATLVPYKEDDEYSTLKNQFLDILKEINPNIIRFIHPDSYGVDDGVLTSWMKTYNFDLREFLFNKKYVVIVDGDEYCIWQSMLESGIIDKNVLENPDGQNLW